MIRGKNLKNLQGQIADLYISGKYYVRLQSEKPADFEHGYWHTVIDPDGKKRNRLKERKQYIEDIKYVLDYLKEIEPGRILDIGCGLGWFLSALPCEWEKYGLEVSKIASDFAAKFGTIFYGMLSKSGYKSNFFDVIFMHHVIEHLESPEKDIKIVKKILKPGGILMIGTPDFDSGCARLFGKNYRLLHDKTHVSLFSNDSMHRFLRDNGFKIVRAEYPFFKTRFFTKKNLIRLFDSRKMSPPFYGNFMTFFCENKK